MINIQYRSIPIEIILWKVLYTSAKILCVRAMCKEAKSEMNEHTVLIGQLSLLLHVPDTYRLI